MIGCGTGGGKFLLSGAVIHDAGNYPGSLGKIIIHRIIHAEGKGSPVAGIVGIVHTQIVPFTRCETGISETYVGVIGCVAFAGKLVPQSVEERQHHVTYGPLVPSCFDGGIDHGAGGPEPEPAVEIGTIGPAAACSLVRCGTQGSEGCIGGAPIIDIADLQSPQLEIVIHLVFRAEGKGPPVPPIFMVVHRKEIPLSGHQTGASNAHIIVSPYIPGTGHLVPQSIVKSCQGISHGSLIPANLHCEHHLVPGGLEFKPAVIAGPVGPATTDHAVGGGTQCGELGIGGAPAIDIIDLVGALLEIVIHHIGDAE